MAAKLYMDAVNRQSITPDQEILIYIRSTDYGDAQQDQLIDDNKYSEAQEPPKQRKATEQVRLIFSFLYEIGFVSRMPLFSPASEYH